MHSGRTFHITSLRASPLHVALQQPFVISSSRVEVTPNVLVEVELLEPSSGQRVRGMGEAATLPGVTKQSEADVAAQLAELSHHLPVEVTDTGSAPAAWYDAMGVRGCCARQGLDAAIHDALGRMMGTPVYRLLQPGTVASPLRSDITLSISSPEHMATEGARWAALGFRCFKVKVGRDRESDLRSLRALRQAVVGCTLRLDANGGYSAHDAVTLVEEVLSAGLKVECFEQPCAASDLEGLAQVSQMAPFDIVADESLQGMEDLRALLKARACDAVNLKLSKLGGLREAMEVGHAARASGLRLMVGAMVESRLGISAAAHLAWALGGVDYPDLDTAWLLASDPFTGGYRDDGPDLHPLTGAGLGVALRA